MSQSVAKFKVIQGLIERNQIIEANLMAAELGLTIDQIMSGGLVEEKPIEKKPAKQLMPMFAGRIGAGGRQEPGIGEAESESVEQGV